MQFRSSPLRQAAERYASVFPNEKISLKRVNANIEKRKIVTTERKLETAKRKLVIAKRKLATAERKLETA